MSSCRRPLCRLGGRASCRRPPAGRARSIRQEAQTSGDPAFAGFSADRGKAFFLASHGSGDTPSCSTCHTTDPTNLGRTRVGKAIKPMAVSANPDRFTDLAKVEKWFRRNCNTVLGRECTPAEKGDFIAFMTSR